MICSSFAFLLFSEADNLTRLLLFVILEIISEFLKGTVVLLGLECVIREIMLLILFLGQSAC